MKDTLPRLRALALQKFGLAFDATREAILEEVALRRAAAAGKSPEAWIQSLEPLRSGHPELAELARELTVTETSFFRHRAQLEAFADDAVAIARSRPGPLRVLSAGCSTGAEPASLLILLRERPELVDRELIVRAIDLNPHALDVARAGRATDWTLRETSAAHRARWFRPSGRDYIVDPEITRAIQWDQRNLVEDDPELWAPGSWDVVFCRNVLMYFPVALQREVVARVARSLAPGGLLFLGHAETLRGLSQAFDLVHRREAFYYRRIDGPAGAGAPPPAQPPGLPPSTTPDTAWAETIREASERIRTITASPTTDAPQVPAHRADLRGALQLLALERYPEARAALEDERRHGDDPDLLLLDAVLLTHGGDLAEAQRVAQTLLALDGMNAGAHYVMALCREQAGDLSGAADHDQTAAWLDPSFAMPRLHLGLLARRTGDKDGARRELGLALQLLDREDPSRILLFGGGFRRDALLGMCRTQWLASGGGP